MFEKKVYINRRNKLRKSVRSGLILFLGNGESPANYPSNAFRFRQDSSFLYFFGLDRPGCAGVMDVEADTDCLYGDDFTMDDLIWMGPQPSLREQAESVGVKSAFPLKDLYYTVASALKKGRKVHFLPPYRGDQVLQLGDLLGIAPGRVKDYVSEELIRSVVALREIKEEVEVEEIERACEIGYLMHTTAMKVCRPGQMERDVAAAIEGAALSKGAGVSFHSIVSQHGETLHNHYHGNRLEAGKLLLIDAGAETVMNYASDYTRTLPVDGKFTSRQKDIYELVLAANDKAFELIRPNVTYKSVHLECARVIAQGLIDLGIMKGNAADAVAAGAQALFMPHGLGHQMGLDVHDMEGLGEHYVGYDEETGRSSQFGLASLRMGKKLRPGHVVTVEPGIYFIPALIRQWEAEKINASFIDFGKLCAYFDFGGVRIEDDALVMAQGCRLLGKKRVPVTVRQVEDAMAKS